MSARAPFFSSGTRPESRAAGDQHESSANQPLVDNSNILRQDGLTDVPAKERDINDVDNKLPAGSEAKDTQYKPLNVNGLIRGRTHSKPPQRILINEENVSRPGTADPHILSTHGTIIAAPTPFKATRMAPPLLMNISNPSVSSGSVSSFNFKTSETPSIHIHGENDAHTPTETYSSSRGTDVPIQMRSVNGFGGNRNTSGYILDDKTIEDSIHGFTARQNTSGKRRKDEMETSVQVDQHQKYLKRFKSETSLRHDTRVENSASELSFSRDAGLTSNYRPAQRRSGNVAENHSSGTYNETNNSFVYPGTEIVDVEQDFVEYGGALDRLLGRDINAYAAEHLVDRHEQAVKRWCECSLEEWYAGAEGIISKYSKILELAKERMNAKLALYASLDKKIEQREILLAGREEMLSSTRAQLVKEGESVLGRSLGI